MKAMNWCSALLLLAFYLFSCSEPEPLKIGFLGSITGPGSALCMTARDGAQFAVEMINDQGGINGRPVKLITYDDQSDEVKVREGVNALTDSVVVAIIGPLTSQMSAAATPIANQRKITLMSPTTSTLSLSGLDDHFFRVYPTCDANARALADHAINQANNHRMTILANLANASFTSPWQHCFKSRFTEMGGEIIETVSFDSRDKNFSFLQLAKAILEKQPDGILVLTGSMDAALFSQQVSKLNNDVDLYGSDWAFSGDLVQYGGKSVEGFTFTTNVDMESDKPTFLKFKKDFTQRFDNQPKFPTVLAYEAAQFLFKALTLTTEPAKVPEALKKIGKVDGLQDTLQLDAYGDVDRPSYINQVRNGRFIKLHSSP